MNPQAQYNIRVSVKTRYLAEQSDEADHHYVFAYTIRIENVGQIAAQLISRHWIITDANNVVQEVRGVGVVGEQPRLQPGESFEYTSGCTLPTPVGTMRGSYQMVGEGNAGNAGFDVAIEEFVLAVPQHLH